MCNADPVNFLTPNTIIQVIVKSKIKQKHIYARRTPRPPIKCIKIHNSNYRSVQAEDSPTATITYRWEIKFDINQSSGNFFHKSPDQQFGWYALMLF